MYKKIILFGLLLTSLSVYSQTFNGSVNSNWSVAANWTPNAIPAAGSNITIGVGKSVIYDINSPNPASIFLDGTLTLNSGTTLTISSNLTGSGNFITLGTGVLNIAGTFSPAAFSCGTGTVNYNGAGAQTIKAFDYYNLTVSNGRVTNNIVFDNSAIIGISNVLTIATTGFAGGNGYVTTGTTINYNGTGNQSIVIITPLSTGSTTYNNLVVTNPAIATVNVTKSLAGTIIVGGNLTITSNHATYLCSLDPVANSLTVNGTTTINGNGAWVDSNNGGTNTFIGNFTNNINGSVTSAATSAYVFQGGITNNGIFNISGAGTFTFNTNSQTIQGTGAVSFGGAVNIANDLIITNKTTSSIAGILNGGNANSKWLNDINSTLNYASATAPMVTGILDANTNCPNIVNYNGNIAQAIRNIDYCNLVISGLPAANVSKTVAGATTFNVKGNLTIGSSSASFLNTFELASASIIVNGATNINQGGRLSDATAGGSHRFDGLVTIASGTPAGVWDMTTSNAAIELRSGFSNNGTITSSGTGIYSFTTNSQSISGASATAITNIAVPSAVLLTNNNSNAVSGLTIGVLSGAGNFTNGTNSVLSLIGTTPITLTGTLDFTTNVNTVNYSLGAIQNIFPTTYNNLTISGGAFVKTLSGNVIVNGALNFISGTISIAANTLTLKGNLTGTPLLTGGATSNILIDDIGASSSISIPAITLLNLTLNRALGISLSGAVTTTNLILTNGLLTLGSNNLTVTNPITGSTSSYVVAEGTGALRQIVAASNVAFPVGTSTSYLPISLNNTGGTSDTYIVNLFNKVTSNGVVGGTQINNNIVNATWVIGEVTAGGSNLTVTPQWNAGNEVADFDRTTSILAYYNSGSWHKTATTAAIGINPYTQTRVVGTNVGSFAVVDDMFLGTPGLWTGIASSDWNIASNWSDFSIPDATIDVTIPASCPFYPLLNTAAATCKNLTIANGGSLTANSSNFTVNGTTTIQGSFIDNADAGIDLFVGSITLSGTGSWTSTSVTTAANMIIRGGISQNSSTNFNAGTATFNTNSQIIQGTGSVSFGGTVNIANDLIITNKTTSSIAGILNGGNANSKWLNDINSTLNYASGTAPMVTGILDASTNCPNIVNYNGNIAQAVRNIDYCNLVISGLPAAAVSKTVAGATTFTVKGNLTIGGSSASFLNTFDIGCAIYNNTGTGKFKCI